MERKRNRTKKIEIIEIDHRNSFDRFRNRFSKRNSMNTLYWNHIRKCTNEKHWFFIFSVCMCMNKEIGKRDREIKGRTEQLTFPTFNGTLQILKYENKYI